MNLIQVQRLAIVLVGSVGCVWLVAAPPQPSSSSQESRIDAYQALHQSILDTLRESFRRPHALIVADSLSDSSGDFSWDVTTKVHEKHVLRHSQYDGQGIKKYLIIRNVNRAAIADSIGSSTESMAATAILNHYFAPLESLGFRNQGSPMAGLSAVQYAANTWLPRERFTEICSADSPAWIEGEVFYAPEESQVIIRVTVGGRFVPAADEAKATQNLPSP